MSDPLWEASAKALGPFSPIIPVPVDDPAGRDWGDVYDDVMAMIERYNEALALFASGLDGHLGHVKDCMEAIEEVEKRLGVRWDAYGLPSAQGRRWRYRVC
jgi:hypothetical protein